MLGVFGLGTLGGRLLSGYLVDRFFAPYIAAVFFLLGAVGIGLIPSGAGGAVPTFGIVLLGIAAGTEIDMLGYLSSRYFGLRHFGSCTATSLRCFRRERRSALMYWACASTGSTLTTMHCSAMSVCLSSRAG
jgi:MFS family permease